MNDVKQWLKSTFNTDIDRRDVLAGGDICQTERIVTSDGRALCVKQQPEAPSDFFAAEAAGLSALRDSQTLRVPEVYAAEPAFIAMEYIEAGRRRPDYWEQLGHGLAELHNQPAPAFGFTRDNYCGTNRQPNPRSDNGHQFYIDHRLLYQGQLAEEAGHLSQSEFEQLERLCQRLPQLIPEQAPALLHGDLWAGNIHNDEQGAPVLIDPACYWGWPEAEIAMTRLFGGFGPRFYESYQEVHPLEPGWQERVPLYNLYHLLNHLNLFGSSYHSQVVQILERYS